MADALKWLQLPENKVAETLKNKQLSERLAKIVQLAQKCDGETGDSISTKSKGNLLYSLGSKVKNQWEHHLPLIVRHICNENVRTDAQFAAACDFLLSHAAKEVDEAEFEAAAGVGVVVSVEEIEDAVSALLKENETELLEKRYTMNAGKLLGELRRRLPFADGAAVKRELDLQLVVLLGPKTADDLQPKPKAADGAKAAKTKPTAALSAPKGDAKKAAASEPTEADESADSIDEMLRSRVQFHKVGENFKTDGYVVTPNTTRLLQEHVKNVGGKVHTRFPPEPNGILHIGHAKAININFGYAKASSSAMGGNCYLRFDDTNPEKEEEKFFRGIEDMVKWLGYTPFRITHSSDYFDQLYEWAEKLIEKGLAYVDHQRVEEMRGQNVQESPWRNRPKEESLALFRDMKHGKFDEGEATLRLKHVMEEGKVDPVAYRIKFVPHHRTGNKWCIYPTYDYTHCLCDSIENITHSLCTKEFQSRRSSYYWLCNALDLYCPVQWEYGRLNVAYTVVSKRKILSLIETGVVNDWDDPRLFTLTSLRRRGVPPEAINKFVAKMGVSVARSSVHPHLLDAVIRDHLNAVARGSSSPLPTMVVVEPLKLRIVNFDELNERTTIEVPDFPAEKADDAGAESTGRKHAIAFDRELFKHENPEDKAVVPGGFLTDVNEKTLDIFPNALCDRYLLAAVKSTANFQFERIGFFARDDDSTDEHLVFNRTVSLREDSGKN
ncbi:Glutaminyl-tRNA synthetase [Aphelenchoides fujianensis]|nr:Glutaminyl-tRNA synthetase [Aphelenchoides fujianensis]